MMVAEPRAQGGYTERDVSSLLGMSLRQIRSFADDGLIASEGAASGMLSFEDVVLLRAAKDLIAAKVSPRRVRTMLRCLRRQLPQGKPLSGVRIRVDGGEIVARDGSESWAPESGQLLFDFRAADAPAKVGDARTATDAVPRSEPASRCTDSSLTAVEWYERGCELEERSPAEARQAYVEALKVDPEYLDAHLDLGRLLHEASDFKGAEDHYRQALAVNPRDATAAYNLGVVLEDIGLTREAIRAYEAAIEIEPRNRDAYHNAVRLYEKDGDKASAVRLLKRLRELAR